MRFVLMFTTLTVKAAATALRLGPDQDQPASRLTSEHRDTVKNFGEKRENFGLDREPRFDLPMDTTMIV